MKNEIKCKRKNKKSYNRITNSWNIFEMKSIDFEKKESKKENTKRKKN